MGKTIYGVLSKIPLEGGVAVSVGYQIPLRREAVQILIMDTSLNDQELKDFASEILKSVLGPSSW